MVGVVRNQRALLQHGTEVGALGSATTVRGSPSAVRPSAMNSSNRTRSGPPISTMPSAGARWLTSHTAAATSSAAIGWNRREATERRHHPSPVRDPLHELEELRGANDRVRNRGPVDQLLLGDLRPQVAAVGDAVGPDHREGDEVPNAGLGRGREQVGGGGREELHHRVVLEGRRVRDVDQRLGALEHLGEPLAGERVDARSPVTPGRPRDPPRRDRYDLRTDQACSADDNDLHDLPFARLGVSASSEPFAARLPSHPPGRQWDWLVSRAVRDPPWSLPLERGELLREASHRLAVAGGSPSSRGPRPAPPARRAMAPAAGGTTFTGPRTSDMKAPSASVSHRAIG